MARLLPLVVVLAAVCGCAATAQHVWRNVVPPEQRSIDYRDPSQLPPYRIPASVPPRTVSDPRPESGEWLLSLDEAIRVALEHAQVVRVLTGLGATTSGQTIYDAAITNTTIDQEQARFDPNVSSKNQGGRTNSPQASFDPRDPFKTIFTSTPTDEFKSDVALTKTNGLGGQWSLDWIENPMRFHGANSLTATAGSFGSFASGFPLNPQNRSAVELSYTQPLLQGGGFRVNLAPIVIARLNTERSFFQYKDSVQELVRGVIEAYWNLVQARTDVWARKIQVDQSKEAYEREQARKKTGFADLGGVSQARTTYNQFRANLIAAEANVLAREGAIRNLLGLPTDDGRKLVPVSAPTTERLRPDWDALIRLAEQRRPDVVELKLIVEADYQRLLQAENQALPKLDAVALYRWNGLDGNMPNGEHTETGSGQFTDWSVGINFSVPLGLRAGRAQVRQQSLIIARDRANVEQGVHAAVHEVAATVRDLDNAFEQYLAFKEARAAAFDNLQVQIELFRSGRNIYLNVLQALNDFGNTVTAEAQALLTYNVSLARLERQTGTILETHGLVFVEERFQAAGPLGLPGHERLYPSAIVTIGSPRRYPGSDQPAENAFDLRNPDPRETAPKPRPVEMLQPRPLP